MNNSEKFVDFLSELNKNLPIEELSEVAKNCIIDYLACAYAGKKMIGENIDCLLEYDSSNGNTPIIGFNKKTTPSTAALINAMIAHSTELDDGHRFAMLHIEVPVIAALISAVSNGLITDAKMLIKGIIMGFEVTCRLAQVMQPNHKMKGFHGTGTCATCGAAMAIGFAAGYSQKELKNTLSAAVASAAGLLEMIDSPSQLKPYTVGNAAQSGYVAALIGKAGFVGPNDPLCGKRGFYNAFSDEIDIEQLFVVESNYKIEQRYTKPYASCRHCHPPIEAALKIKNKYDLDFDSIEKIDVETYSLAIFGHDNTEVGSVSAAKMSTPFSIATALINGTAGFDAYSLKCIDDERITNLAKKIFITESREYNEAFPKKRGAIVTIKTVENEYAYKVDYPLGEPENPMEKDVIIKKFYELGRFADKDIKLLDSVLETIFNIENNLNEWINIVEQ